MKVKITKTAIHRGTHLLEGDIRDLPEEDAVHLIKGGLAVDLMTAKKLARDEFEKFKAEKFAEVQALEAMIGEEEEEEANEAEVDEDDDADLPTADASPEDEKAPKAAKASKGSKKKSGN